MLSKNKILPVFLITFALCNSFFFSCNSSKEKLSKEPIGTGYNTNAFFPVNGMNKWQYINEAPREESVLIDVNIEAINSKSSNGVEVILNSFPFFSGNLEKTKLVFKENGQVYSINKDGKEELFLESADKFKQSNKWSYGQWEAYVGSTTDKITTEIGTYENCIYINFSQYFTFAAEVWLAKDVGIVKWGYNRTNPPTFKPLYYVLKNLILEK